VNREFNCIRKFGINKRELIMSDVIDLEKRATLHISGDNVDKLKTEEEKE
jgi:hypothetical protein